MKKQIFYRAVTASIILFVVLAVSVSASEIAVSGKVENGYRILPVPEGKTSLAFTVYRGDYIKFAIPTDLPDRRLVLPSQHKEVELTPDLAIAPYFKMKDAGTFDFTVGGIPGQITVVEYEEAHYKAISAEQATIFIQEQQPLILDVRTPEEYRSGHLENSVLIPVQVLSQNIGKLEPYMDKPILIYCATGNRSTVAAKILIDSGFSYIRNMRYGMMEWNAKKLPVEK